MEVRVQGVVCPECRAVPASTQDMLQPRRPRKLPAPREGLALSHLLALAAVEGKLLFLGLGFFPPSLLHKAKPGTGCKSPPGSKKEFLV